MKARSPRGVGASIDGYRRADNDDVFAPARQAAIAESACKDPMPLRQVYGADMAEVLSSVEDLWLRLASHPAVHAAVLNDATSAEQWVMFRVKEDGRGSECGQLLVAASSSHSYLWHQDGSQGSLVSDIQWLGSTLVLELTSKPQRQRWPDGEAMDWQLQTLLNRIQGQGRAT